MWATKRFLKLILASASSQLSTQIALWLLALAVAGKWIFDHSVEKFLLGALAIAVVGIVGGFAIGVIENRHENFTVIRRTNHFRVYSNGGGQTLEIEMKIRSRTKNLNSCEIPFKWLGVAPVTDDNCSKMNPLDDSYTIAKVDDQGTGDHAVDIVFSLSPPLAWFRRKTVGVKIEMEDSSYQPRFTHDPRIFCWSPFASLTFKMTWDRSVSLNPDQIKVLAYRCGWARVRLNQAPLNTWKPSHLKIIPEGRKITIRPVRKDRWYMLEFAKPDPIALPPPSAV